MEDKKVSGLFNDDFFASVGMAKASDDKKAAVADNLARLVQERYIERIEDNLTPEQLEELDSRANEGETAINEYLDQVLPTHVDMMQQEIDRVREQFTNDVEYLQNKKATHEE